MEVELGMIICRVLGSREGEMRNRLLIGFQEKEGQGKGAGEVQGGSVC